MRVFQHLKIEQQGEGIEEDSEIRGPLVRSSPVGSTPPLCGHFVHYACWCVVVKVTKSEEFDQDWLDSFFNSLYSIGPLVRIQSNGSPNVFDNGLYDTRDDPHHYKKYPKVLSGLGVFDKFDVPPEIRQTIFSFLDTYEDIIGLETAARQQVDQRTWISAGKCFMAGVPNFANLSAEGRAHFARLALKNTELYPEKFPSAVNRAILWDALEIFIRKMGEGLRGDAIIGPHKYPIIRKSVV